MKKIVRMIVEYDASRNNDWTDSDLATWVRTMLRHASMKGVSCKSFSAVMARERKKGKREKTRFEADYHAKGGHARAKALSPARRKAIARKAANTRWNGR